MQRLYSTKVIQLRSDHTAKRYNINKQRSQSEHHSSMYSSNAVGRRRIRTGRPEPEADWDWDWDSVSPEDWLSWSNPGRDWVPVSGVSSPSVSVSKSGGTPESASGTAGGGFAQEQTVHMNGLSCALGCVLNHHHQWRLKGFDAPRSGP